MSSTNLSMPEIIRNNARKELIKTAKLIIESKLDLVKGARLIDKLSSTAEIREDTVFFPVRSFVSQTEHLVIDALQDNLTKENLDRNNKELNAYSKDFKNEILITCKKIVNIYS